MTIAELLKAIADDDMYVQLLHECLAGATRVKSKKGSPAHTRVTFVTQHFEPGNAVRDDGKVAMILWIPRERYKALVG